MTSTGRRLVASSDAAQQPAGERRDGAAEKRNGEQHRPAHAGHPQGEQHEAAEAVAPDRTDDPRRKRPAWSWLVHEPRQQESRDGEPDGDAEESQTRTKRDDRPDAQRDRAIASQPPPDQPATRTPRAGGFKPGQAVDLHRVSRIGSPLALRRTSSPGPRNARSRGPRRPARLARLTRWDRSRQSDRDAFTGHGSPVVRAPVGRTARSRRVTIRVSQREGRN